MANPTLLPGFDTNNTNSTVAPGATILSDGYAGGMTPLGEDFSYMLHELYNAANKNKKDGVWDWDSAVAAGSGYGLTAVVRHLDSIWISESAANADTPGATSSWTEFMGLLVKTLTHDMTVDSDYTLTAAENEYGRFVVTDTLIVLTTARNIIVDTKQRAFYAQNDTAQTLVFKTSAGIGIPVLPGQSKRLYCDGTNVITPATDNAGDSIPNMQALVDYGESTFSEVVVLDGYYSANDGGGGTFIYDATVNKNTANAGTIIDPSVSLALQGTGVGFGCWVRQYSGYLTAAMAGAYTDYVTDSTTYVQDAIDVLSTTGGFILINRGVLYTFSSLTIPQNVVIFDEENSRIVFHDCAIEDGNATNLLFRSPVEGATRVHIEPRGNPVGTSSKLDVMFDPYQDDGANYRLLNMYTKTYDATDASTMQGNNGVAVLGVKGTGVNFGIWPSLHVGFSDDGDGGAVPMKLYYFDTSDTAWRTPMLGGWRTGIAVTTNDYILASNKLYQATSTGTTGATIPSHSSGTVSDGGVDWLFVRDFAAVSGNIKGTVLFGDRDNLPKFGLPDTRVQFAKDATMWNGIKLNFLDSTDSPSWSMYSPVGTDDVRIESNVTASYLRFDATGKFIQNVSLARLSTAKTISDNSATPDISSTETVAFGNTVATNVTSFSSGLPYQILYVQAGNSNTTLVHGTNIKLSGAVNKTLTVDDVLLFQFNSAGTVAKQIIG